MKNYKFWLAVVIILLMINCGVLALMWFHKPRAGTNNYRGHLEPKDVLINTLSLTAKQQDLFTAMRTKHQHITNTLNQQNRQLRDSLFNYIKTPGADTLLINSLSNRIGHNQSLVEKATLYHFREFRAILTTDQQQKFDGIIQNVLGMMNRTGRAPGPPDHGPGGPQGNGMGIPDGPPPENMPPGRDDLPEGPPPR